MDRGDRCRYLVVGSVFMEIVAPLFRQRLENHYSSLNITGFRDFINRPPVLHTLFHLRYRNVWCCTDRQNCVNNQTLPLCHYQWNLLYTENPGPGRHHCHCKYTAKPVSLDDLDITLTGLILMNCCNLPQADDEAVERLRQFKNDYLSHNTTGGVTQAEYNTLWADLKMYVLQLDPGKSDDLVRIENRPLDEPLCNKYFTCLLDVHKKHEEMEEKLGAKLDANNDKLGAKLDAHNDKLGAKLDANNALLQDILNNVTSQKSEKKGFISHIMSLVKAEGMKSLPYTLGQDIFRKHHKFNLNSVLHVDWIGGITGAVMMDDGRLVLCLCDLGRLLICNTDGSEADSIQLLDTPYDVTAVNNSTVAVTLHLSYCIEIYDINNKHKLKSIPVPGWCWGITTINNKLVVGCIDRRLLMLDHQTGEVIQTIKTDCRPWRVHAAGDRIFYCDDNYNNNNTVYCYSYTDDKVTTTTLPSTPLSITSLQDGSLYVVCEDKSVQHVSSDGKHYKPVTTKVLKGMEMCDVISYNPNQRQLMTYSYVTEIVRIFNEI